MSGDNDNDDMPTPEQLRQLADKFEAYQENSEDDLPELDGYQMIEECGVVEHWLTVYLDDENDVWLESEVGDNYDLICIHQSEIVDVIELLLSARVGEE